MERLTNTFEALIAALADAVKQLGEAGQQRWTRTRVEEAKHDFVSVCDIMCFQLKAAVDIIRQEMLQSLPAPGAQQGPSIDGEQVRQVLLAAEQFAAQLSEASRQGGLDATGGADGTMQMGTARAMHDPMLL